jgi:hypothetical protein
MCPWHSYMFDLKTGANDPNSSWQTGLVLLVNVFVNIRDNDKRWRLFQKSSCALNSMPMFWLVNCCYTLRQYFSYFNDENRLIDNAVRISTNDNEINFIPWPGILYTTLRNKICSWLAVRKRTKILYQGVTRCHKSRD